MELQINVLTPKGQAEICMKKNKNTLLGFKKKPTTEKLISDKEFMWIIPVKDKKEMFYYQRRLTLGEGMIKGFYKQLYKFIRIANRSIRIGNKLGKAGKKGIKWLINRMSKLLQKEIPDPKQRSEMMENLKLEDVKIDGGLFKEIIIDDQKEMDALLSGELIKTKILN